MVTLPPTGNASGTSITAAASDRLLAHIGPGNCLFTHTASCPGDAALSPLFPITIYALRFRPVRTLDWFRSSDQSTKSGRPTVNVFVAWLLSSSTSSVTSQAC